MDQQWSKEVWCYSTPLSSSESKQYRRHLQLSTRLFFPFLFQVWVIVCMKSLKEADELLTFDLPILKKMGAQVYTTCKSIRPISRWIEDLKKLV